MYPGLQTESRIVSPGTELAGRYRIEALLGQGASGSVYRAVDLSQGRDVALKVLAAEVLADDAGLARFRREADLAQRLSHPNVVRIFDFGRTANGDAYIALELVRGQTLAALLRSSGPLPPERIARIGSQILKGLMEAHAQGIVHRDIKPSNVQVCDFPGEPDFVKILDFGIAKKPHVAGDTTGMTRTGQVLGTPSYMAPEQVLGLEVGPSADLYAVGLLLAEMIAGRPVYGGGTAMQIMMAQASAAPVPLTDAVRGSPFGSVVQRATCKDPAQRYGSASEMLAALLAPGAPPASMSVPPSVTSSGPAPSSQTLARGPGGAAIPFSGAVAPLAPIYPPGATPAAPRPSSAPIFVAAGAVILAIAVATAVIVYVLEARPTTINVPAPPVVASSGASSVRPAPTASGTAGAASQPTSRPAATGGAALHPTATTTARPSSSLPMCLDGDTRKPVQAATPGAASACNTFGPPYGNGVAYVTFNPSTGAAVSVDIVILSAGNASRVRNPGVESCMRAALMKVRMQPCSWTFAPTIQGNASFNLPGKNPSPD